MSDHPAWYADDASLVDCLRNASPHWGRAPHIPGYEHLLQIQRGGQGVIYRALHRATGRTVAIKVLLEGTLASESNRLRFEREFDAVARLRHPDIVSVYDRGTTADGLCYYAMEYVEGVPIGDPAVREARSLREILALVARIADAVQHAHQRGIIHRDLKPGNIVIDPEGNPHILDFGLAKLVESNIADVSGPSFSQTGEFLGSLAWASPEQLDLQPDRVDSRTDVYSLGVILYQLLTGLRPYPQHRTFREIFEAISVASPTPPRQLRPDLPDDVSTIVLRCLAKEPARRYQTPGDLAEDLRCFLAGKPINAKRDRTGYVLRKLIARHPGAAGLASLLFLMIVGFAVTMSFLYQRATSAERMARQNLEEARMEAAKSDAVRDFMTGMLSQADPNIRGRPSLTVRELLDAATRSIQDRFAGHPEIEAEVRQSIGLAYLSLGHLEEAEQNLQRALDLKVPLVGRGSAEVADVLTGLARVRLERRDYSEGERLLLEALDTYRRELGAQSVPVADCLVQLADLRQAQFRFDEALAHLDEARTIYLASMAPDADPVIETLLMKGVVHLVQRRLDRARDILEEALSLLRQRNSNDRTLLIDVLARLGLVQLNRQAFEQAEALLTEAIQLQREVYGNEHPHLAALLTDRAKVFEYEGQDERAAADYQAARDIGQAVLGRNTPEYARATWDLGCLRWRLGDRAAASPLLEEAIERYQSVYEPDHHFVGASLLQYGLMLHDASDYEQAGVWLQKAIDTLSRHQNADSPMMLRARHALGECLIETGDFQDAESHLLAGGESGQKMESAQLEALVRLYERWGKPDRAEHYRSMLARQEQ